MIRIDRHVALIAQLTACLFSTVVIVCGDIPVCNDGNKGDHPFCIPSDYNKDLVPPTGKEPLNVNIEIFIFEVSKIDDIALTMTFELYFDLFWKEPRFLINETSDKWMADGSFMGSTNYVSSLWLPDIQIYKCKQFRKRQIVTDVAGLIIFKDKHLIYTISTEVVIDCQFKFSAYPLDHQSCKFMVGSYIHDETQITFSGTYDHDVENQRAQQYVINCTKLHPNDSFMVWQNRTFSYTGFQVELFRRRTPVLLQVYLPSGLFVIVSWISFIVPPEVVPGRMSLLVTLFLVLVNIFNSVTANAPKAEGLTAVETWVVACIIHVFGVLAEYAIILKIIQNEKRRDAKERRAFLKSLNAMNGTSQSETKHKTSIRRNIGGTSNSSNNMEEVFETDPLYHEKVARVSAMSNDRLRNGKEDWGKTNMMAGVQRDRCVREKIQEAYEKVDRVAMWVFPAIFLIWNGGYWSYYLIFFNIFHMSLF